MRPNVLGILVVARHLRNLDIAALRKNVASVTGNCAAHLRAGTAILVRLLSSRIIDCRKRTFMAEYSDTFLASKKRSDAIRADLPLHPE